MCAFPPFVSCIKQMLLEQFKNININNYYD